jgi:uncharacterized membrane protein YfcA
MSKVSAKGVLIGGIVDVVTSFVLGFPFTIYAMSKLDLSHLSSAQMQTALTTAIHNNVPLYAAQLLVGLACSVLGGYVAARLAKREELLNGALSSFICVVLGVYMVASGNDSTPHWLQALMFIASPALALLGGYLMQRSRRKHTRERTLTAS